MKKWIIFDSVEIGIILLGWLAWVFRPQATLAIAIGWGVALGISVPHLVEEIMKAVFFEKHKKQILEEAAKALSAKLGRDIKPEDFEETNEKTINKMAREIKEANTQEAVLVQKIKNNSWLV